MLPRWNGSPPPRSLDGRLAMKMNPAPRRDGSRRVIAGIVLSVVAHLLLVFVLWAVVPDSLPPPSTEKVRLNVVDKPGNPRDDEGPLIGALPPRMDDDEPQGQVVTLPRPEVQKRPDSARFLSQYDISVDKEQVARRRAPGAPGRPGTPADGGSRPQARDTGDQVPDGMEFEAAKKLDVPSGKPGQARFSGLKGFENLLLPSSAGGWRGAASNMRSLADEMVSDGSLAQGGPDGRAGGNGGNGGSGGSDDVFMGVEDEGDVTLVNSRSFKFWAFFDSVKAAVRAEWDPGTVVRARDPSGSVFGKKDRYTIISVVLNPSGEIQQLEVSHKSGLDFLDEEAVRAFKAAGPFPNPPAGLIDENGRIVFRFGFLLEFGSTTGSFFWQRPG